ncbi:phosphoribosyltransferase [Desulforamulus reducens MI-1]|uniref:Phosphoribosyltransferase n=1 Tax=Desulforamulus reducens (strain ATCC BAA-1160 / DSM 100696 / MI-1) TaxID=349161 RepID=A4J9R2_DESRM|nr:phosphoribosyltransferase [Desulforamulus reducens]ABO51815.1 phosphoribosyltransferase [Desulforamulus reducens MI-1]
MFENRIDAGQRMAVALEKIKIENGIVMAIPRGGVVVGAQIAQRFQIPLDIIIPKKIGLPHNPEIAIGAVTEDGTAIYNEKLINDLNLTPKELEPIVKKIVKEIERRRILYKGKSEPAVLSNRHAILVDDGIATGATVIAALRSLQKSGCKKITLAIPVAPPDTVERLEKEVDHLICLVSQEPFYAVGQFYKNFCQIDDDEVISLLAGH